MGNKIEKSLSGAIPIIICMIVGTVLSFTVYGRAETSEQIMQQIEKLKDPNKEIRHKTFKTLAELGKPAVPILLAELEKERLNEQDETVRAWVIHGITYALGDIKDKSAVPSLTKLLKDKDGNVIIYATEALCMFEDEIIIDGLLKRMTQEVNIMEEFQAKKETLTEEDSMKMSAHALTSWSIPNGIFNCGELMVPFLIKALNNQDWEIRYAAVCNLQGICQGDTVCRKKVVEALIAKLDDDNPKVKNVVKSSLSSITAQNLGDTKEKWQIWWGKNRKQFK